jgi:lipopolysaccharide/colanic/teichoic acid biosynthesis glycosyltransferase
MKRSLDILFSSFGILVLSPVLFITILILRLTGEGEIFFIQNRIGKDKKTFGLLKFATMMKDSENIGAGTVTLENDFRVLPFGKFLRKTKINELPQLFNVLLGNMSIIGPRPLHEKQFSFYNKNDQDIISSVRPGLSGVGSIVFRDEEKILQNSQNPDITYKNTITPKKAILEKWFVSNQSIFLYFKLIILTLLVVIFPNTKIRYFLNLPKYNGN